MHYRDDIDGLRAVAVVAVMLFHAGILTPGGFVGVDVFFVISGFLITGLIAKDLADDRFSLQRFWQRRICRIWPASLAMTATTLVAAWVFFLPDDYKRLAGDSIAQICMLANVRYVGASDYFAPTSDLRPLLHTWSLAVEEQFYVVFPLVMLGLQCLKKPTQLVILCIVCIASFCASEWATRASPGIAFYLLPFRAWEMLLGSMIAIGRPPEIRRRWCREGLAAIGLTAILVPMWQYGRSTPFPGLAALPPCAGAAALILAGGGRGCMISRFLAAPPLTIVGQMSYSLYLWHWPTLAFLRYVHGVELPPWILFTAYVFTALVSVLSWRFIETPFRRGCSGWTFRTVFTAAAITSMGLIVAAQGIRATNGAAGRFLPEVATFTVQPEVRRLRSASVDASGPLGLLESLGASCQETDRPCLFFWGDSHGIAIRATFDDIAKAAGLSGYALLEEGAPPIPGVWRPGDPRGEAARHQASLLRDRLKDWITRRRPRNVIVCGRWSRYLEGGPADNGQEFLIAGIDDQSATGQDRPSAAKAFEAGLRELTDWCKDADASLWFLCEVPYQPMTPRTRALSAALHGGPVSVIGVDERTHKFTPSECQKFLKVSPRKRYIASISRNLSSVTMATRVLAATVTPGIGMTITSTIGGRPRLSVIF